MLARLATEKPSIIGLGTQSSVTVDQNALKTLSNEQLALEAGGVAGIIGGVGIGDAAPPGLSPQWSSIRVPCIEQLDKTEPPATPESYLYALVLSCVNSLSEGLAKFILPIATPSTDIKGSRKRRFKISSQKAHDSDATSGGETVTGKSPSGGILRKSSTMRRKYQGVINPLTLENHPLLEDVQACASIVDDCWPAVLALYSTFLYATLDSEYYHGLVRSLQKFTQVAGVLDLYTPRDTFLTTLGKAAVPPQVLSSHMASSETGIGKASDTSSNTSSTLAVPQIESKPLALNVRNLTCLRALLNVGTALGATLKDAWTIVLEALQQTDYILQSTYRASTKSSSQSVKSFDSQRSGGESQSALSNVGPEISAVEGATQRLFESTKEFSNEAFQAFLNALCDLLDLDDQSSTAPIGDVAGGKAGRPALPVMPGSKGAPLGHRRVSSIGNRRKSSSASTIDNTFVISKLGELVQVNIGRLITDDSADNGWDVVQRYLLQASTSQGVEAAIRLKASDILHELAISAARTLDPESVGVVEIQERILNLLLKELDGLEESIQKGASTSSNKTKLVDADIHKSALEALTTLLEQSGENLKSGWTILFRIMNSAFKASGGEQISPPSGKSTITYFWNISDFLQRQESNSVGDHDFPNTDAELLDAVQSQGGSTSMVLWLILLLRLAEITKDTRSEVRNGSIQTLFRIFDSYGHILGPKAWNSCLNIVVFKMMSSTEALLQEGNLATSERKQWDETVVLVLKGTGNLYTNFLNMFQLQASFETIWTTYIRYLRHLLDWRSFEVTKTVYKELARLLEKATTSEEISFASRREAWDLWALQGKILVEGVEGGSSNNSQETLTAFIDAFRPLYKLMGSTMQTSNVEQALGVFRECMLYPELPAYFFDVETMSALQLSIIESIKTISTDSTEWTSLVLKELAFLSRLPYKANSAPEGKNRSPSYVAVASNILGSLAGLCLKHASSGPEIYDSNAIYEVLGAICEPIQLKYEFRTGVTTRKETLWIQATRVSLQILTDLIPLLDKIPLSDEVLIKIWEEIVSIVSAVVTANCDDEDVDTVTRDEEFYMKSFEKLRALVIPRLGRGLIPEELAERYVESIFNASLLYRVNDGELDISFKGSNVRPDPLFGCTSDLVLERRSRMSYVCLNELFELCRNRTDGDEWISLAQVAIPWMLLRVSIVLRRFAADQPLRGKTPQPRCQRKEILYIIHKFTQLQCAGFGEGLGKPTSTEDSKRHLVIMFPFISQAARVAYGDSELLSLLTRSLDEIGSIY
ncbi:hypothetical protein ABW19_dt0207543 [Dactylella cylindrospora]|nr:hypothetical protein ABW19_dt0207543 [Dactylella cylindrospora]